jgi:hypothetical protein
MSWVGHVGHIGQNEKAYRALVAIAERGKPPGRLRHNWKGNIKVDLTGIGWDGLNWVIYFRKGQSGRLL